MKVQKIRIPKFVIGAIFASIGALILVAILAELVAAFLPSSPQAKILFYMHLNNNNPEVFSTNLYRSLVPQAQFIDAFVATPISMLFAGAVFGMFARKNRFPTNRVARASAIIGVLLSIGIIAADWFFSNVLLELAGKTEMQFTLEGMPGSAFLQNGSEILLSTAAYVIGAVLIGVITGRRSADIAQSRVAGTKAA